jgi:hypothetical protein
MTIMHAEEIVKSPLEVMGRQAGAIQQKRVPIKDWDSGKSLDFTDKRIALKSWSKHFSSVGSKRAPIDMKPEERRTVTTERKRYPVRDRKMSSQDQKMADVKKMARIGKKDKPLLIRDSEIYGMMLQEPALQEEFGKQLSLRDLNRFQFRRNHSKGAVPVKKAGSEGH